MSVKILEGDVLDKLAELPDNSVHCCITSPPYWGLRDYGVEGQLGLEKTPEEYIAKMVQVFADVRRVLREDGTLWLNLGDSYANANPGSGGKCVLPGAGRAMTEARYTKTKLDVSSLKPKDLCGIPWRLALALQADGWWLRSDIIWYKRNPMPESVTDRPTKSHEYIFLLTKSAKYYYDAEAVKEGKSLSTINDIRTNLGGPDGARNLRSVWDITTKGYPGAHFATFPPELPERCIKAGTSEKGVCSKCGAGWVRDITKKSNYEKREAAYAPKSEASKVDSSGWRPPTIKDNGWKPGCKCNADVIPATVLDIFGGSGTVGEVAERLGRDAVLIELNPKYIPLIEKRCHHTNMFSTGDK